MIRVEDIDIKAMSRSLHFGKSVMDNGYGMFRTMLAYKLEEQGESGGSMSRIAVICDRTNIY